MATKIDIRHDWDVAREVVLEHLFDEDLGKRVDAALKSADRHLVSQETQEDGKVVQRFEVKASADDIPAAARKVLPAAALQWTEESVWDPSTERFSWKIVTQVMQDKIHCDGSLYYENIGGGRTRRIVEGTIDIKIPLAGRMAEKVILGQLEKSYDDAGRAEEAYFKEMAAKSAES
jgi:hypothetical protein